MVKPDHEPLKKVLAAKEALGIICYNKHSHKGNISAARISEILKIPINKVKETCAVLEESKVIRTKKMGQDLEIELNENPPDEVSQLIDEIIWEHKQEYGLIYKKLITAELLDFMGR